MPERGGGAPPGALTGGVAAGLMPRQWGGRSVHAAGAPAGVQEAWMLRISLAIFSPGMTDLGHIDIINDGSGSAAMGHYRLRWRDGAGRLRQLDTVADFPRQLGAWELAKRAMALVPDVLAPETAPADACRHLVGIIGHDGEVYCKDCQAHITVEQET